MLSAERTRSHVWWEDTLREAIRRTMWRTNNSNLCNGRISPYFCQRPVATASVRQESLIRYIPRLCIVRGWYLKGDILVADIEQLEKMDGSEIHAKRLNAKEVLTPKNCEQIKFPVADGTVKLFGGDQVNIHLDPGQLRPRRRTKNSSRRIRRVFFNSISRLIAGWWWSKKWFFWSVSGNYTYRHHVEPRVKLHVPTRDASFPIPLK